METIINAIRTVILAITPRPRTIEQVQAEVDELCADLTAIRQTADVKVDEYAALAARYDTLAAEQLNKSKAAADLAQSLFRANETDEVI